MNIVDKIGQFAKDNKITKRNFDKSKNFDKLREHLKIDADISDEGVRAVLMKALMVLDGAAPGGIATDDINDILNKDNKKYLIVPNIKSDKGIKGSDMEGLYTLRDVVIGFFALNYSLGYLSEGASVKHPGYTCLMGDGIPAITFKELEIGLLPRFMVANIHGLELDGPKVMTLDEIRKVFTTVLNRTHGE